jgi:alpha-L-fucosidase
VCWQTIDPAGFAPGHAEPKHLNGGDHPGTTWLPAECDVSIRPGWFYHQAEDGKVKSPQKMLDLYFASVGRGATFLLNVPPDRRGRIHEADAKSLREFGRVREAIFAHDLARNAKVTASNTRSQDTRFQPRNVTDGQRETYWSTDDSVTNADLVLDLGQPRTFSVVRLREFIPLGQRIESFALDEWQEGQWDEFATGAAIGNCRLVRTKPVTTSKVRLRVLKAPAPPAVSEVGLFQDQR